MASNEIYKTRAGIQPSEQPSEQELSFCITTSEVEQYLQRKLNATVNGMRQNGLYKGDDIKLKVITLEIGSKFRPFIVLLSMNALAFSDRNYNHKDDISIFHPKKSDSTAIMFTPLMKLFSQYSFQAYLCYNDDTDEEPFYEYKPIFYDDEWRQRHGVSLLCIELLNQHRLPRVHKHKFKTGNKECISFIIDPIRAFQDMLIVEGDSSCFNVDIYDWQKICAGEFRYDVNRVTHKKNGKQSSNNFAGELSRKWKV